MSLTEKTIGFHICTPCTLNCRLCATNTPLYKREKVNYWLSPDTFRRELQALFKIYDHIGSLSITGGEPLLHRHLDELVKYALCNYFLQFDCLRIITNGTLLPSETLLLVILENSNDNVLFVIDDYGELSPKTNELVQIFEENHIPYKVNCYHGENQHCGGWVDLGPIHQFRGYSESEVQDIFHSCHLGNWKCMDCFEGKLYLCALECCGAHFHYFELKSDEYIDLFDESATWEEKKKIAAVLGSKPVTACYYCNGFDPENSPRFPAGEQMK